MQSRHRPLALAVMLFVLTTPALALAAPSASIEQVRNGTAGATFTPTPTWGTGNAGASNSHYLESHSIAYRTVMNDLPSDGTVIELIIGYDVKRSGSYALDYLTHHQRLLPHVLFGHRDPEVFDPLAGITGVAPVVTTAPIPLVTRSLVVDPDGSDPEPAAPQPLTSMAALSAAERTMTLYGGTLIDVSYVSEADVSLASGSSESQVKVRFTADGPRAVLAWGGHIASRWDWGFNANGSPRSAGGINGSSYHMRLVTWNLGNLGNQDRSMSTDAVYPVPRCAISNLGPFCAGTTNTHTAPEGMESYAWMLADNTSGAAIVGSANGLSVTVHAGTGAGGYRLVLTTAASGFTRECSAPVSVLAPVTSDAGPDQAVCATAPQVQLAGLVSEGTGSWTGGAGTFSPGRSSLTALYTPTAAEIAAGGVTLTLVGTSTGGVCPPVSDAVRITVMPAATVQAGPDQAACATAPQVQLAGATGGGVSTASWSGGQGTFTPSATTLNAVYTPTAAEIAAGTVTLTLTSDDPAGPCGAVSDAMTITIQPAAVANAGADAVVCASSPQVQLGGVVSGGASSGSWSGGTGTFAPNRSSLTAVYSPSASEIAAGTVTLTLVTNDPAGPCGAVSDAMVVTIQPAAVANAGADAVVCASSPQVQLAGAVNGGASSGSWSGGTGTFAPGRTALSAVYTPSAAEIAAGTVTLTLVTNDPAGPCGAVSDAMVVTIQPAAVANAGADRTVCASSPQVQLAGAVSGGASGGTWSGGAGTFSPRATALNATYTPTSAEIAAGSVTLVLTSNDPAGPCPAVSDAMRITIDPVTVVSAGPDQTVCASSPQVQLAGAVSGTVAYGSWSGGSGTFSPGASSLQATYTPSAAEIAAGSVTLTLTSGTPTGPCPPASDAMTIRIDPNATVNAGPDQIVCAAAPLVQLAGVVGGAATSATWSGGGGTFNPAATALNATYTPSPGELAAGSVTLTLSTNDPGGPCPAVSDAVKITFDAPSVAVKDRIVCTGVASVTLCATPGKGISPFTWRWSNGATTQCITVQDTGSYTVTMTDAKGCQATASGRFRQRECVGQLAHTSTTCESFQAGTGEDLPSGDIHYVVRDGVITSISPGVFFYWTKVSAPSADFTVQIVQTRDNPAFPLCEIQQDQVALYDAQCTRLGNGVTTGPGQGAVEIRDAAVGQVFIISVKYSLKNLIGSPLTDSTGVHYDFRTVINGQVVDADPDGLTIGVVKPIASMEHGDLGGWDDPDDRDGPREQVMLSAGRTSPEPVSLAPYRPVPNPFRDGMQMAYAVEPEGGVVSIGVYDLAGRLVRRLADGFMPGGSHLISWDGRGDGGERLGTGVYFVHLRVGREARLVRVAFLR